MNAASKVDKLLELMPELHDAEENILRELRRVAQYTRIPAGKDVFTVGARVNAIALLINGTVRVYKIGSTGREITLYRFSAGQSCILTANAILSNESFSAIATVEEEAEAILIPADQFREWVNRHQIWREFVFQLISQRLSSVMEIVDEVAFGRMDARVAALLLQRTPENAHLTITHQEIADELGSSREVISRILGSFASEKLVLPGRGSIRILDRKMLESIALM